MPTPKHLSQRDAETGTVSARARPLAARVLLCLLCALLAQGCGGVVDYFSYTRDKPNEAEVAGTWVPDAATLTLLREEGGYQIPARIQLVLHPDGRFEMNNMPDWWADRFGKSAKGFHNAAGRWGVSQRPGGSFWSVDLNSPDGYRSVSLLGQKPPYRMRLLVGDPDLNRSMTFVKEGS